MKQSSFFKIILFYITLTLYSLYIFAGEIDSLKTAEDVSAFLRNQKHNTSPLNSHNSQFYSPSEIVDFHLIDMDNNGTTDLIIETKMHVEVILDMSSYCYCRFQYERNYLAVGTPKVKDIIRIEGIPLLLVQDTWYDHRTFKQFIRIDTLVFKFNNFIHYNPHPQKAIRKNIDTIFYKSGNSFLRIDPDRRVSLHTNFMEFHEFEDGSIGPIDGSFWFHTYITSKKYKELLEVLSYVNLPEKMKNTPLPRYKTENKLLVKMKDGNEFFFTYLPYNDSDLKIVDKVLRDINKNGRNSRYNLTYTPSEKRMTYDQKVVRSSCAEKERKRDKYEWRYWLVDKDTFSLNFVDRISNYYNERGLRSSPTLPQEMNRILEAMGNHKDSALFQLYFEDKSEWKRQADSINRHNVMYRAKSNGSDTLTLNGTLVNIDHHSDRTDTMLYHHDYWWGKKRRNVPYHLKDSSIKEFSFTTSYYTYEDRAYSLHFEITFSEDGSVLYHAIAGTAILGKFKTTISPSYYQVLANLIRDHDLAFWSGWPSMRIPIPYQEYTLSLKIGDVRDFITVSKLSSLPFLYFYTLIHKIRTTADWEEVAEE
ncbi:hypothetical protein LJC53_04675 [Bacteroidales bacterium OttesenSCG-928-C03]|nr:hypothetical protein [Bacteroidales bacterium OttesenSCG-928-C03]MDL2325842.1 hypothetical protein [Bacteroidales bacterium OttesenSCG-928-A14]